MPTGSRTRHKVSEAARVAGVEGEGNHDIGFRREAIRMYQNDDTVRFCGVRRSSS